MQDDDSDASDDNTATLTLSFTVTRPNYLWCHLIESGRKVVQSYVVMEKSVISKWCASGNDRIREKEMKVPNVS